MSSKNKVTLMTGVTGEDGSYLSELLLEKGYEVHGIKRRASQFITDRVDHLYHDPHFKGLTFHPRSPYGVAKLYAYWICKNYREAYNMFAVNGILFNNESPRRGETFVTRKITRAAVCIANGLWEKTFLGNLNARRDWGHARDYVNGTWLIMQQDEPEDFVLVTGQTTSVRAFCEMTFREVGIELEWRGEGVNEAWLVKCVNKEKITQHLRSSTPQAFNPSVPQPGDVVIEIAPQYFRPTEVDLLLGGPTMAQEKLEWEHEYSIEGLVKDMVTFDFANLHNNR